MSPALPARLAVGALFALGLLTLLWELALAPLRPGGSWLVLKCVPLFALFPGVAQGQRRARQWLALVLPFYAAEGLVRAMTETGRHAVVAGLACVVAIAGFGALLAWFRAERRRALRPDPKGPSED